MGENGARFIEMMGQHVEEEGVPRIFGRLMGALLLNAEPRSLDELAEQLQVSKGSISSNARSLDGSGIAERITLPGDRRDYYQLSEDFVERVLYRQLERHRLMIQRLEVGREAAPESVRYRFDQLIELMRGVISDTEARLAAGVTQTD